MVQGQAAEQVGRLGGDHLGAVRGTLQGAGPGPGGEVVQPDLERDGAGEDPGRRHPLGDQAGVANDPGHHLVAADQVGLEGVLHRDRLAVPVGRDLAVVAGERQRVQGGAVRPAEFADQFVLGALLQVGDRRHAEPGQPVEGGRADAGDDPHRQRRDRPDLGARGDEVDAVGLVELGGELGDELRGAEADRAGEPAGPFGDLGLGPDRHGPDALVGEVERLAGGREVDEGLVERQRFDQRGEVLEDRHHDPAGRPVGAEPAGEERGVGAQPARLVHRHRGVHAVRPSLVRGGGDHPALAEAADDDGSAAQRRLVALLDRGEERIQVEVHDRGLLPHPAPPFVSSVPIMAAGPEHVEADGWAISTRGR